MASILLIVDRARAQYDCSERFGTTRTVAHFSCGVAGWREFQDAEVEVKMADLKAELNIQVLSQIRAWSRLILAEGRDWQFFSDCVATRERNWEEVAKDDITSLAKAHVNIAFA
jgi:hypothetical protein